MNPAWISAIAASASAVIALFALIHSIGTRRKIKEVEVKISNSPMGILSGAFTAAGGQGGAGGGGGGSVFGQGGSGGTSG